MTFCEGVNKGVAIYFYVIHETTGKKIYLQFLLEMGLIP